MKRRQFVWASGTAAGAVLLGCGDGGDVDGTGAAGGADSGGTSSGGTTAGTGGSSTGGTTASGGTASGGDTSTGGEAMGGDSSTGGTGGESCGTTLLIQMIVTIDGTEHPHVFETGGQPEEEHIVDGSEQTYTLTMGHDHTITVTAADFTALKNGETVLIMTDEDEFSHRHNVTLVCGDAS